MKNEKQPKEKQPVPNENETKDLNVDRQTLKKNIADVCDTWNYVYVCYVKQAGGKN